MGLELNNSIPLDVCLQADRKVVLPAANHILAEITSQPTKRNRLSKALRATAETLMTNLFVGWAKGKWLAYSRNKNTFHNARNKRLGISGYHMVHIADFLTRHGYIEHVNGVKNRETGWGRQSRMKATPRLVALFGFQEGDLPILTKAADPIVLRDKEKHPRDFPLSPQAKALIKDVEAVNLHLDRALVTLELTPEQRTALARRMKGSGWEHFTLIGTRLYRVFNGDFVHGGRWYGHWLQSIPKEYRRYARIDGEPVCELDYSGLHIRMLYDLEEQPLCEGDVYAIPGYTAPKKRKAVKVLLQASINAPTEDAGLRGAQCSARATGTSLSLKTVRELHGALSEKHAPIRKYFMSGAGRWLQYLDSLLALGIMKGLRSQGIVAIPIHDSFIVQDKHREDLRKVMKNVYCDHFGRKPDIDDKY